MKLLSILFITLAFLTAFVTAWAVWPPLSGALTTLALVRLALVLDPTPDALEVSE